MNYLSVIYKHIGLDMFLSSTLEKLLADFSEEEQTLLKIEIKCFELMLDHDGDLIPVFVWGSHKRTDIDLLTPDEVVYIDERLKTETHAFLIARYAHILFKKNRNNKYAFQAIGAYDSLAKQYFPKLASQEKNVIDFISVIKAYVLLSLTVKYKLDDCRITINGWYKQPKQSSFYYRCFLDLFANSKLYKKEHVIGFTAGALDHLINIQVSYDIEDYLKACLGLAKKEAVNLLPIYQLLAENQNELAEQQKAESSGMIAVDYYLSAARYYKSAKNLMKSNEMLRLMDTQKKNIKMSVVSSRMDGQELQDFVQSIQTVVKFYVQNSAETVFIPLAIDKRILPSTKSYKPDPQNSFLDYCHVSSFDINTNTHILSEYDKQKQKLFNYYQIGLELTLPLLFGELIKEMKMQQRNFVQEGLTYFEGSWFQIELQKSRTSDFSIVYQWMPMLRPALNLLLENLTEDVNNQLSSEQQMAFDQLAVKFEGLLRDLCQMANITITKVLENQTMMLDINELLKSKELSNIFEDKDIELWQYAFCSYGYNIRNNVAHAFYRPSDYTTRLSTILLMAYVRLAIYGSIVTSANDETVKKEDANKA